MLADDQLRHRVHSHLLASVPEASAINRSHIASAIEDVAPLLDRLSFADLVDQVLADVNGLGPLEALLSDDAITDIMVSGDKGVWVERNGVLEQTALFLSAADTEHLIERVVSPLGLRVDRSSPMVDARLPDGSRVNAVLPPLAVDGPCLTIRKFAAKAISLEQIAAPRVAELLRRAVRARLNILVSGGTGAGKTTLLNALGSYIEPKERIVTIEDAAELRLALPHVVRLEGRSANSEGVGTVTLRSLLRNSLRMRPDRIIVGEVRGPEAPCSEGNRCRCALLLSGRCGVIEQSCGNAARKGSFALANLCDGLWGRTVVVTWHHFSMTAVREISQPLAQR